MNMQTRGYSTFFHKVNAPQEEMMLKLALSVSEYDKYSLIDNTTYALVSQKPYNGKYKNS